MTKPNENYNAQLVVWKKTKLFTYFSELGFSNKELNDAWKIFKNFGKRINFSPKY